MTERKPRSMDWRTWIDQQIDEAKERGAFDDLPSAGKPLPNRGDEEFGQAWVREWVQREGVSIDEMLPPPLKLRKRAAVLAEQAPGMRSEQDVRDAVAALNQDIMDWRRIPVGPPIFVPLVDEDKMAGLWRDAQPAAPPPAAEEAGEDPLPVRRPWWRRRRRPM
ncbi:MAG TPA: DUF1992 domain-containing protein [Streptosporangiaceae bacterium]|nr:DUF1992 domain-containing protein [Streptosporangiaceae bacterium]